MKHKMMLVIFCILLFTVLWAEGDTTRTEILGKPIVKTRIKREIIIPKDPFLAGLLSAQMPGVGQMYSSKWLKGGLFLVGTVTCYLTANNYAHRADSSVWTPEAQKQLQTTSNLFLLLGIGIHVWNIVDAYKTANVHNLRMLEERMGMAQWNLGIAFENDRSALYVKKRF